MTELILVVIDAKREHPRYTRFAGRKITHQLSYLTPLTGFWVEEMRRDPEQFETKEAD